MPHSIAESFQRFRSNLEITDPQSAIVSVRQQTVRKVLANDFQIVDDFLTGSYARSTMISPLSEADIDIFICLHPSYFSAFNGSNGGPAGLLDRVKASLRKTYTSTPNMSRNGQAVTSPPIRLERGCPDPLNAIRSKCRYGRLKGLPIPHSHCGRR
jgi:hypothetical protein